MVILAGKRYGKSVGMQCDNKAPVTSKGSERKKEKVIKLDPPAEERRGRRARLYQNLTMSQSRGVIDQRVTSYIIVRSGRYR